MSGFNISWRGWRAVIDELAPGVLNVAAAWREPGTWLALAIAATGLAAVLALSLAWG